MAFWAKRPFAIAPYMSENAFVAFVVVKVMGYSWQVAPAAGAVSFIAGCLFRLFVPAPLSQYQRFRHLLGHRHQGG